MTTVANTDENIKDDPKLLVEIDSKNDEINIVQDKNENLSASTKNATVPPTEVQKESTPATTPTTNDDTNKNTNNIPDYSIIAPNSPSSSSSTSKNQDSIFEPTVDMMVNDFDDEATLEEEEALAAQESEDASVELSSLQKESDMPIEELLALYNFTPPANENIRGGRIGAKKRGKKRKKLNISKESGECTSAATESVPSKKEKTCLENVDNDSKEETKDETTEEIDPDTSNIDQEIEKSDVDEGMDEKNEPEEDAEEEMSDGDGDGETEIDGVGVDYEDDDDDGEGDSKEISQLRKLYPETYGSCGDKRLLRTISRQQSDEEEDVDYSPDEDEKKKTIMVGSEFQALIPEGFSKYDDVLPYENEDKLLWDPSRLNEDQTEEYLTKAQEQAKTNNSNSNSITQVGIDSIPCGKHLRDDEQALYLLLQCGHNTEEALRRKRINPVPSTEQMSIWSEEECKNFESVLRLYGKDFHTIKHAKVHTRSVGELVQFYYLWKKTERHDVFANKARLEKKKYNLNPGLTDYMDRFLEELDTTNSTNNATTNLVGTSNITTTASTTTTTPPPLLQQQQQQQELNDRSPSPSSSGAINGNGIELNDTTIQLKQTISSSITPTSTPTPTKTTDEEISDLTTNKSNEINNQTNDNNKLTEQQKSPDPISTCPTPTKSLVSIN